MIVLEKQTEMATMHPYVDMFHKEVDAYCTYKAWADDTNDKFLERAFEEMMEDEYLHAKFLHDYLMDHDLYNPDADDAYEKKFWKIHKKYFE
jgi:hypothetical protein